MDVTKIKSIDIVHQIKCEAQLAIQSKAIDLLINDKDQKFQDIGNYLQNHREKFADKNLDRTLPPRAYAFYRFYIETAIAWEFSFDITEEDKTAAKLDPIGLISGGNLTVSINASNDLTRQNTRKFIVSDTFDGLLHNLKCMKPDTLSKFEYPISGSIGLVELIDTFIDLNRAYILRPEKDELDKDAANFVPVFAETLKFTTSVSGSVNPVLTLTPMGRGLHLMDASIMGTASRKDVHSVIIGLSLMPLNAVPQSKNKRSNLPFTDSQPVRSVFAKRSVRFGSAEERAIQAITQQRLDTFYDRLGTINLQ